MSRPAICAAYPEIIAAVKLAAANAGADEILHHRAAEKTESKTVIPAKAGIHSSEAREVDGWIPAFAGMTNNGRRA
jgi:hypothetical protein